jgi:hypothetical protein
LNILFLRVALAVVVTSAVVVVQAAIAVQLLVSLLVAAHPLNQSCLYLVGPHTR